MAEPERGLPYLGERRWSDVTREERSFCAILWERARKDPTPLLREILKDPTASVEVRGHWEVGFEVCFYRDVLKAKGVAFEDEFWRALGSAFDKTKQAALKKRTFDLVLFGEHRIIIVEAKAHQGFTQGQLESFEADVTLVQRLLGPAPPRVDLVALVSSKYRMRESTRRHFSGGVLNWLQINAQYPDPYLERADRIYAQ